jgi:nucleoside-diphosphate-sugar epimerase
MYSQYQKYASEYIEIEQKIKKSGLDYTIIRPTMIYGNHHDKNIHKLVKIVNRFPIVPIVGAGDSLMQPIYAKDLADVIAAAALSDASIRKEYNVAGKEPITYKNLIEEIARALGKKRLFLSVPYSLCLACGYLGDLIPNGLVNLERIQRLKEDKAFDYSLARDELGFSPRSFQEGIVLEIQALREAGVIS